MAEFQEVAKMYDRLCDSFDDCRKCPMFRNRDKNDKIPCSYWTLIVDPELAEEVILRWAKEHPTKKNYQKFEETFGINPILMDWWNTRGADWLMEEFKEPKDE